jgi:phosphatidylglycerophosphatase A
MIRLHRLISSCFGLGYLKGGGTLAAMVTGLGWYLLCSSGNDNAGFLVFTVLLTALGIWSSTVVEPVWGKDSSKVVIDEAAGMCLSVIFLPVRLQYLIAAFVLFRVFDILKPFFIRRLERLPAGWGVMADDLLAAAYANLILRIMILCKLF